MIRGSKRFVLLCVRSSLWAAADRWGVCLKNAHAVGLSGPYSGTAGLAARGDIVADAGMVIVSVPIHVTEQVIAQLPPLPSDCILVDLASVKSGPLQAMLAAHDGPVLGLHPMFGPTAGARRSRWWSGVTGVNRKRISGSLSKSGVGRAVASN